MLKTGITYTAAVCGLCRVRKHSAKMTDHCVFASLYSVHVCVFL